MTFNRGTFPKQGLGSAPVSFEVAVLGAGAAQLVATSRLSVVMHAADQRVAAFIGVTTWIAVERVSIRQAR